MALLLALSAALLGLVWKIGSLDFGALVRAFPDHPRQVLLCGGMQILATALGAWRYFYVARGFEVELVPSKVLTATCLSQAIGQWMPGSLALIEILRMGLLTRGRPEGLAKLGVISSADRVLALGVMFLMGSVAIAFALTGGSSPALKSLLLLSILAFAGVCAAFVVAGQASQRWAKGLVRVLRRLATRGAAFRMVEATVRVGRPIADALGSLRLPSWPVAAAALVSVVVSSCGALAMYFGAEAVGTTIPLAAILGALPLLTVASVLPMGFAGLGGQQVLAIAVFSFFSLSPESVATASLLVNVVGLLGNLVLALVMGALRRRDVLALLAAPRLGVQHD